MKFNRFSPRTALMAFQRSMKAPRINQMARTSLSLLITMTETLQLNSKLKTSFPKPFAFSISICYGSFII